MDTMSAWPARTGEDPDGRRSPGGLSLWWNQHRALLVASSPVPWIRLQFKNALKCCCSPASGTKTEGKMWLGPGCNPCRSPGMPAR